MGPQQADEFSVDFNKMVDGFQSRIAALTTECVTKDAIIATLREELAKAAAFLDDLQSKGVIDAWSGESAAEHQRRLEVVGQQTTDTEQPSQEPAAT